MDIAMIAAVKKGRELSARKVKKGSHNRSIPLSSDGYDKSSPESLQEEYDKKEGGQIGNKGNGMQIKNDSMKLDNICLD